MAHEIPAAKPPDCLQGAELLARFVALNAFLIEHQALWRPRPFYRVHLPWEADYPELAAWLRQPDLAAAEVAHNDPTRLAAPAPFSSWAQRAQMLGSVGELPNIAIAPADPRQNVGVPGRKWRQIEAFASRLDFAQPTTHWLDWCSGKGHLGRRLVRYTQALSCWEYDQQLVDSGAAASRHLHIRAEHRHQDVMAPDTCQHLHPTMTVVALHACGDLHVRLLHLADANGCRQLAIAPCCYNRIANDFHTPLSTAARHSELRLSKDDLALPLNETVTAGANVRRQRDLSMARRLAFDILQRRLRGQNEYLPTPSLPSQWLHKPFETYCRDLAALKEVPDPGIQDWAALEHLGWQRLANVRNLELVGALFRRPLELWLLLDQALYLQERGWHSKLGEFCAKSLTPRNLLLLAERP